VGLLINQKFENGCQLGLWEIVEDYETLFQITYLNNDDIIRLNTFKNTSRKVESLSVRALLQQLTRPDARIVYYGQSRKPYLDDNSYNISVTHSNEYTAILLSKDRQVGIDIEYMSHNIDRIAQKFINKHEIISNDPQVRRKHLYVHWCAKEVLYKICNKEDINFKEDLRIKPFEIASHGYITGIINNQSRHEEYNIYYMFEKNYALAYCFK